MQPMQSDPKPEEGGIDPLELKKLIFGLARMFEGDQNGSRDISRQFNPKVLQPPPRGGSAIQRDATNIGPQQTRPTSPSFSPNRLQPSPGPIQQDATGLTAALKNDVQSSTEAVSQQFLKNLLESFQGDQEIPRTPGSAQEAAFEASKKPSIGPAPRSLDPRDYLPEGIQKNLDQGPIGTGLDAIGYLLKNASIADVETGGINLFTRGGIQAFLRKVLPKASEAVESIARIESRAGRRSIDESLEPELQQILESEGLGDIARRDKDELIREFDKLEADVAQRESDLANITRFNEEQKVIESNAREAIRLQQVARTEKLARPLSVEINTTQNRRRLANQGPHDLSEQAYGDNDFISKSRTDVNVGLGDHTVARLSVEATAPMIGSTRSEGFIPEVFVWNQDPELFDEFVDSGKLNEAVETAVGKMPYARAASSARIYYMGGNRSSEVVNLPNLAKNADPNLFQNARSQARQAMAAGDRPGATAALRAFLSGETRGVSFGPSLPVSPNQALSGDELNRLGEGRTSTNPDPAQLGLKFDESASIHVPPNLVQDMYRRGQLPPPGQRSKTFYVRDEDGNIIGSLGIQDYGDTGGKDLNVFVHEDYRRQGIATNLYQQAYDAGYDIEKLSGYGMSDMGRAFRAGRLNQAAAGTGGVVTEEARRAAPRSDLPYRIPTRTPAPPGGRTPLEQAQVDFERASQDFYHSSDPNAVSPRWEDFAPPGSPKMTLAQMQYNELYASQGPRPDFKDPAYGEIGETPLDNLGNELRGERKGPLPARPGEENRPRGLTGTFGAERPAGVHPSNYSPAEQERALREKMGSKAYDDEMMQTEDRFSAAWNKWWNAGRPSGSEPEWKDFWRGPSRSVEFSSGGVLSIQPQGPKESEAYPHGVIGGVNFVDLSRIINQPPSPGAPGGVLSLTPQGPENISPNDQIVRDANAYIQKTLDDAGITAAEFNKIIKRMMDSFEAEGLIPPSINKPKPKPPKPPSGPRLVP